ncbi:Unknown protein, partial [Striga hermonthica]
NMVSEVAEVDQAKDTSEKKGEFALDESEDDDYKPSGESSSNDGLSNEDLGTDNEKYLLARREVLNSRQSLDDGNANISSAQPSSHHEADDNYIPARDIESEYEDSEGNLGMRFESVGQCRKAIQSYAIYNGCNISFIRSSSTQVEARCEVGCPWRLYASLIKGEGSVAVKTFVSSHSCHRDLNTKQATASWVAREYLPMIRKKPKMKISDIEDSISEKYGVQPSRWKLYKAKTKALKLLRGIEVEHYGKLRRYIAELQRVDKNGTFKLVLESGSVFKCFYVGFSALRQGFLQGCRPIIGFDGCFLKTFLGGVSLCAVGKDGNNQIFPLAWAVVDFENESNWKWFLYILFQDLWISDGLGWTFIRISKRL